MLLAAAWGSTPARVVQSSWVHPIAHFSSSSFSETDRAFIRVAGERGRAVVRSSELAQEKASSASVRRLAKVLGDYSLKSNHELAQIAGAKGIDLPSDPGPVRQRTISGLESIQGNDFDRAFVQNAIANDSRALAAFESATHQLNNAELAVFAQKSLRSLRVHLWMAQWVSKGIGVPHL